MLVAVWRVSLGPSRAGRAVPWVLMLRWRGRLRVVSMEPGWVVPGARWHHTRSGVGASFTVTHTQLRSRGALVQGPRCRVGAEAAACSAPDCFCGGMTSFPRRHPTAGKTVAALKQFPRHRAHLLLLEHKHVQFRSGPVGDIGATALPGCVAPSSCTSSSQDGVGAPVAEARLVCAQT